METLLNIVGWFLLILLGCVFICCTVAAVFAWKPGPDDDDDTDDDTDLYGEEYRTDPGHPTPLPKYFDQ